jgi:hypothetical protein
VTIVLHGASAHLLAIGHTGLALRTQPVASFIITAGQVFLPGVLDDLVGARLENKPAPSLAEPFQHLPLGRLMVVDILVSIIAGVAALAFVIPEIIAFALFGIVGPVINVEDRGIVDALRRSAYLVGPHLWVACVVIVVPFSVELAVEARLIITPPFCAAIIRLVSSLAPRKVPRRLTSRTRSHCSSGMSTTGLSG